MERKDYLKSTSTRNPFEIRTRMLEIAQEYLEEQHKVNMEFARQVWMDQMAAGAASLADMNKFLPKMYEFKDIVEKANYLYNFVQNKD